MSTSSESGSEKGAPKAETSTTAADSSLQSIRPTAAGSKRPLMTHTKDGKVLSEKKLRRLEKNRLSARECRRRKREATEKIEHEINVLEAENLRLRLQMQIGEEAEEKQLREQTKLTEDIDALLKSGASEAEIYAALESFKEKYADYGRDRRSAIEFHLRNVQRLLMPTQTTSVVMRAIQGGQSAEPVTTTTEPSNEGVASAVSPSSIAAGSVASSDSIVTTDQPNPNLEPKALFQYLVNHLEVTPQQAAALKDSRLVAREMDGCLEKAFGVLDELRRRLAQTGEDLETEFNNVRNILTPTQAAKFLVWVANNNACMHMLNELWERVYPAPSETPTAEDTPESSS